MLKILILALICATSLSLHLAEKKYYINTAVENFIDGGIEGKRMYFNQLINDPNIIKCPFNRPFTTDGKTCFQCTLDLPIFNFATKRCETCPTGTQGLVDH